jgi:surfeit locus 1 family protein
MPAMEVGLNASRGAVQATMTAYLAAFAVIAGCAWLAQWQVDRADEKREIIERWNDRAPVRLETLERPYSLPQPIAGVGIWDSSRQILIDNRIRDQRTGVDVLTPLRIADGRLFLVNRGWAAWPARTAQLPDPGLGEYAVESRAPGGRKLEIQGVLNAPPGTGIRLGDTEIQTDEGWPVLVTYFDHGVLAELFGDDLEPAVVQLDPDHPAHLTGDPWKVVTFGPDRHIGYAMTWTSIAVVVAVIWLVLTIRQARRRHY